jgi:hypothetical protein
VVRLYHDDLEGYMRVVLRTEPDTWQREVALSILRHKRLAVASGHGIGKTRMAACIVHWFMATRPHPQIVITANTQTQLITKTMRELAVVNKLAMNGSWFNVSAMRMEMKDSPQTWFAQATPWTKEHSEAFAGTHAHSVLMLFDEASSIDDAIWEVAEGAMTTPDAHWICFGNPTRATGRFRECWGRFRHRWHTMKVDSRTAKYADQTQIQQWIEDYGLDSDFVKVRVLGEFPSIGSRQLIPSAAVDEAMHSEYVVEPGTPKVMGVDVARYGDDMSVIARRHGRRLEPLHKYRGLSTMELAAEVARQIGLTKPDVAFIDETGLGAGVVDRLLELGFPVVGVNFGSKPQPQNVNLYYNKRAEMWVSMRDWITSGCQMPRDDELAQDLVGPEVGYDAKMRMQVETKESLKKRGLSSPDCADALALTFAFPAPAVWEVKTGGASEPEPAPDY